MMTQDQANAIAEREYPINLVTDTDNIILCEKLKRKGYAKCLMDLNPLIEAGEKMCDKLIAAAHRAGNYDYGEIEAAQEWDAALGKFTDPK